MPQFSSRTSVLLFVLAVNSARTAVSGDEEARWVGRRVVGEINIVHAAELPLYGIPEAEAAKDLLRNHSPTRTCLGIMGKDGTHAEFVTLPVANLLPVPDTISDSSAVFCEPLAAACRIVEQGVISRADRVVRVCRSGRAGGQACMQAGRRAYVLLGMLSERLFARINPGNCRRRETRTPNRRGTTIRWLPQIDRPFPAIFVWIDIEGDVCSGARTPGARYSPYNLWPA